MIPLSARIRLPDGMFLFGVFLVFISIGQGFLACSAGIAVLEGMISALFWILSTFVPLYANRQDVALAHGLSAVAAGASGGAIMASAGYGWSAVAALL